MIHKGNLVRIRMLKVCGTGERSQRRAGPMFVTVKAEQQVKVPPTWALLERQLFDAINGAAPQVLRKYTRSDGSLLWPTRPDFRSIDGLDD